MKSIWDYKRLHMTGVKGVGMAALAEVLAKNGFALSGSDVPEEFLTDEPLKKLGIAVAPFARERISGCDALVRSNAYGADNPEVAAAEAAGTPVFSYPEVVAELFNAHKGIAVAGSHGKTTTTAMLAHILKDSEMNVTAIVGSRVLAWGSGAVAGDLKDPEAPFVLEADEYKEAFLNYAPKGAIITNIDYDHPDYFKTPNAYEAAFRKFVARIPKDGFLVYHADDKELSRVVSGMVCRALPVETREKLELKVPGVHNQTNAALAARAAEELGVERSAVRRALGNFAGTARRLEFVGERNKVLVYDDYAHHPTEIRATLKALRETHQSKKFVAVFQSHTFSRTRALFADFAAAFEDADVVVFTDVYASAREQKESAEPVDMAAMTDMVQKRGNKAFYVKNKDDIPEQIAGELDENTVVVTMGAGDIWQVARKLSEKQKDHRIP